MPSFQPRNGFSIGGFDDRRANDGDGRVRLRVEKIADERFGEALRERVGIGPAELVRALRGRIGERLAQPADAILANLIFESRTAEILDSVFFFERLGAQLGGNFRRFGARFDFAGSELRVIAIPFQRRNSRGQPACNSTEALRGRARRAGRSRSTWKDAAEPRDGNRERNRAV